MATDWNDFKKSFRAQNQRDEHKLLESGVDTLKREVTDTILVIGQFKEQWESATDSELKSQLLLVIKQCEETLEEVKAELAEKQRALTLSEIQLNINALEAMDELELSELEAPDTGPIAVTKGEITTLTRDAELAGRGVTAKQVDLDDNTLLLHGLIFTKFPALKLLLEAMNTAQETLTSQEQLLGQAREQIQTAQLALQRANDKMVQLSLGTEVPEDAVDIIDDFDARSILLATKQRSIELIAAKHKADAEALAKATKALDDALKSAVETVPTTEPGITDHKSLVNFYAAVVEARGQLARAKDAQATADTQLKLKEVKLSNLEDRAELCRRRADIVKLGGEVSVLLNKTPALRELVVWKESASALLEKMGETDYNVFATKGLKFMEGLATLTALGMTDEEKERIYTELAWPENWHPPSMRPQEANWLKVGGSLDKVDIEKAKASTMVKALGFAEENQALVLTNFGTGMETIGLLDKSDATQVTQWMTLVSAVITLGTAGKKATDSINSSMGSTTTDPVEELMLIDDAISAIGATCSGMLKTATSAITLSGAESIAALVPGLGAVSAFGTMCANAISATNTWLAVTADAAVQRKALEQQHRIEASSDHVATRGAHVASRKTASAATNLITFCSHICTLSGVGIPAATVLKTTATVVGVVQSGVTWAVDATLMEKAQTLLRQAQGGNPEAREEVFRHHGYYATALIALLAEEGDPMALSIYNNHNITKDMVIKSSAKVLQKYLLRELVEESQATSWSDVGKMFTGLGESIATGLSDFGSAISTLWTKVSIVLIRSPSETQLAEAKLASASWGMSSVSAVQALVTDYDKAVKTLAERKVLFDKMAPEHTDYTAADALIKKWEKTVAETRKKIAALTDGVKKNLRDATLAVQTLGEDIPEDSLARYKNLVDVQRRCFTLLAQVR